MKLTLIFGTGFLLMFILGSISYGQSTNSQISSSITLPATQTPSPFLKGNFWFNAGNNFWLDQDNVKYPADKGHENSLGFDYNMLYFPVDHLGVGIDFSTYRDKSKFSTSNGLNTSTMVYLDGLYGASFNDKLNGYVKAGFGFGGERDQYSSGSSYSYDNKYKDIGINFEAGAPYSICDNSSILFTPRLGYEYIRSTGSGWTDKTSGIYFRTGIVASLPCSSYAHDCDEFDEYSEGEYDQGNNFIGGFSTLGFGMGNSNSTGPDGEGGSLTTNSSYSNETFKVQYFRYIFDNIAIGSTLDFYSSMNNNKTNSTKNNQYNWTFSPQAQFNLPIQGPMHNAFGFLEGGFGSSMTKTDTNGSSTTTRYALSDMSLGLGYNLFFTRSFALTPYVDYRFNMETDKSTKDKTRVNGVEAGFSIRHSFKSFASK